MNWVDHIQIAQRRLQEREEIAEEPAANDDCEEQCQNETQEQLSEDGQLPPSNVGFRLLQKMGWKGKGLGKDEQGIMEPIRSHTRDNKLGVGKQEEDDYYTAEERVQRKRLEIEILESEEVVKRREVDAERELKIQSEVKEIKKTFFCHMCNKQYKFAVEFEAHLSSYDHNHRKRFKEMRDFNSSRDRDDRQKREQMRLDKEMARLHAEAHKQQLESRVISHQPQELGSKAANLRPQHSQQEETASTSLLLPLTANKPVIKFGLAVSTKASTGATSKKLKVVPKVASMFGVDSDEGT